MPNEELNPGRLGAFFLDDTDGLGAWRSRLPHGAPAGSLGDPFTALAVAVPTAGGAAANRFA